MKVYRTIALLTAVWASIASAVEIESLQGCCSFHGGIANVCLASGYELCNDGTQSPSCTCSYVPPVPVTITPKDGLWWNAAESGSGYMLGSRHGVMVMTTYSYTQAGAPLWYISVGPITNNTFSATLEKAASGQCISCSYKQPSDGGNDGMVTIVFTSSTTAMMTLAGRGSFPIQIQEF